MDDDGSRATHSSSSSRALQNFCLWKRFWKRASSKNSYKKVSKEVSLGEKSSQLSYQKAIRLVWTTILKTFRLICQSEQVHLFIFFDIIEIDLLCFVCASKASLIWKMSNCRWRLRSTLKRSQPLDHILFLILSWICCKKDVINLKLILMI